MKVKSLPDLTAILLKHFELLRFLNTFTDNLQVHAVADIDDKLDD